MRHDLTDLMSGRVHSVLIIASLQIKGLRVPKCLVQLSLSDGSVVWLSKEFYSPIFSRSELVAPSFKEETSFKGEHVISLF